MVVVCQSEAQFLECLVPLAGLWSRGYTVGRDWAGLGELVEQKVSRGAELVPALLPKPQTFATWRFSR